MLLLKRNTEVFCRTFTHKRPLTEARGRRVNAQQLQLLRGFESRLEEPENLVLFWLSVQALLRDGDPALAANLNMLHISGA